ncbi:hypothetical protein EMCRGX_G034215 [Ephydatia muelleri]
MSLESRVFEQELPNLTSQLVTMDFNQFGNSLVRNEFITQATMAAVLSPTGGPSKRDQAERLAKAIKDQVKQAAERFDNLIIIMQTEPQLEQLAGKILQTYWKQGGRRLGDWKTADSTIQSSQPVRSEPSRPVRSEPSQPVRSEPSRPVRSEPSQPVRSEPSRPVRPEPSQPLIPPEPLSYVLCSSAHNDMPLETSVLMNELAASIPAKWRAVGAQLNVPSGILDAIQAQGAGQPQGSLHCFSHVLEEWRSRRTSPYTWENLLSVLRSNVVGEVALADRLARTYGVSLNQIAPQPPVASVSMSSPASSLGRIDDVPTIGELESFTVDGEKVTIMVDVAERWKDLCIAFNFDPVQRTAQRIEQKWNGNAAKCCLEMFQLWLKTQGASWRRLIGVLDHCKELLLVSLIKAYVGAVE